MAWTRFEPERVQEISGSYGIYEIADADGNVLYAGYAGGRSLFGLQGCIAEHFSAKAQDAAIRERAAQYRYEVTLSYLGRWVEVLGRYLEEHGALPGGNQARADELPTLPRFGRAAG